MTTHLWNSAIIPQSFRAGGIWWASQKERRKRGGGERGEIGVWVYVADINKNNSYANVGRQTINYNSREICQVLHIHHIRRSCVGALSTSTIDRPILLTHSV